MSRARRLPGAQSPGFALYVEGPEDRGVVEAWARRVSPTLGRAVSAVTVILGGSRPARAAEHFRGLREGGRDARGLCVLDRDGDATPPPPRIDEPGLGFFVWGRRHIESYLLVPDAIRRSLRLPRGDSRLEQFFRLELPKPGDESAMRRLDAKALFARHGPLSTLLGRPVRPPRVARAMQEQELHRDVVELLDLLREGLGVRRIEVQNRR